MEIPINIHCKKFKLKKEYWTKGKSKFLHPRLVEDGVKHISQLKTK